jgi:hypothetical protein
MVTTTVTPTGDQQQVQTRGVRNKGKETKQSNSTAAAQATMTAAACRKFNGYFRLVSQRDYDDYLKIIGILCLFSKYYRRSNVKTVNCN